MSRSAKARARRRMEQAAMTIKPNPAVIEIGEGGDGLPLALASNDNDTARANSPVSAVKMGLFANEQVNLVHWVTDMLRGATGRITQGILGLMETLKSNPVMLFTLMLTLLQMVEYAMAQSSNLDNSSNNSHNSYTNGSIVLGLENAIPPVINDTMFPFVALVFSDPNSIGYGYTDKSFFNRLAKLAQQCGMAILNATTESMIATNSSTHYCGSDIQWLQAPGINLSAVDPYGCLNDKVERMCVGVPETAWEKGFGRFVIAVLIAEGLCCVGFTTIAACIGFKKVAECVAETGAESSALMPQRRQVNPSC